MSQAANDNSDFTYLNTLQALTKDALIAARLSAVAAGDRSRVDIIDMVAASDFPHSWARGEFKQVGL